MNVLEHALDFATTAIHFVGAHPWQGRNHVERRFRVAGLGPCGNDKVMRNKVLDIALEQVEKLVLMPDLRDMPNDAEEPLAFICGHVEGGRA